MSPEHIVFRQLLFMTVLGMQYHPRNGVSPEDDVATVIRCLDITETAAVAFCNRFPSFEIPF
jgi:hypothetical protein